MLLPIVITFLVLTLIYFKVSKSYRYWEEKGVPYIKPFPVFGNMFSVFVLRKGIHHLVRRIYNTNPNERYVGAYQFGTPVLVICNLDLIKMVTVKEFDTFPDHPWFIPKTDCYAVNHNVFSLRAEDGWHDTRSILSPAFTNNKLKIMFNLIEDCTNQFIDYIQKQNGEIIPVNLKDNFSRLTNDVIATTSFGVTCNSFEDKKNEFYTMGKVLTNTEAVDFLKSISYNFFQKLLIVLGIKSFNENALQFFSKMIKNSLRIRAEQGIVRPDLIYLMMEANNGLLKHETRETFMATGIAAIQESDPERSKRAKQMLTDDDIISQALLFFIAGFDSISSALCFTGYELARNPAIQQRLYAEIKDACGEKIDYETVLGLKYLDCVVSETLRKWSASAFLDRVSVRPFTIEPEKPHEKPLHLDAGQVIWIPVAGIHKDPKYHPNPDKFDPERFNDENKKDMHPGSFIPFGIGPRMCIASRFSMLEIKIILVKILLNFEIVPVKSTPDTVTFNFLKSIPTPGNEINVGFKRRSI